VFGLALGDSDVEVVGTPLIIAMGSNVGIRAGVVEGNPLGLALGPIIMSGLALGRAVIGMEVGTKVGGSEVGTTDSLDILTGKEKVA